MIGPLLLLVSWVLLRWEGKSLATLGFDQPGRRCREFGWGVLLTAFVAARRLGPWQGCVLGAAAFGVYHWFSYGILGNRRGPVPP